MLALGVQCETEICSFTSFRCKDMSKCIPPSWQCDSVADCPDASDEDPSVCPASTQVEVRGGKAGSKDITHHTPTHPTTHSKGLATSLDLVSRWLHQSLPCCSVRVNSSYPPV
ncbi:hypothetical protein Pcinc_040632 [Petrolisthes cinctipes]|uniref:Uncharacterized protein n=1 Tax=Petrolisthes cinctipes TaxID=88211 RepID=A0AAE1EIG6_PETCI|nr:hypothetical protein Pcinc_040632 [Petrolisthes cinctipes]